ncbi:crotonobetaine/carnitine-CoA ligase [Conexibacter arvalis]|uniref:Crotonobetaine/carnitine-CoA ligase n=1 Tax=Conexibacter arvalis TaxID=912552 RepID=A0A840I928_9ACTN|nr:crotonobetaine/carnitine-CoA ligase [Conexibacter arvalis]
MQIPARERCVIPHMLARRVAADPNEVFAVFDDGTQWTTRRTRDEALAVAAGLRALGVAAGDAVVSWLPNGQDALRTWFGVNQLGAVYVPVNTAYRGRMLEHVLRDADARVAIVHADLLPRLHEVALGALEHVVVVGGAGEAPASVESWDGAALRIHPVTDDLLDSPAQPWDPYAIIYTSGTTGPSKGVVCTYLHVWATGALTFSELFSAGDRYLVNLPMFHAGGTIGVVGCLWLDGGSVAIVDRFDTSRFWEVIRRDRVTVCTLLGVMANFLLAREQEADDPDNPLRLVFMIPLVEDALRFGERFACDVYTGFNMTEVSCPLISARNPTATGSCGRPRDGVEVRLVDDHDVEVAPGEVGELIVRTEMPWTLTLGYWRNPEATARAWRNGWFHTGDAFRVDAEGNWYFVDRMKDALRRRGENISSFEVEAEVLAHPAVQEAAVVGVPSPHGEDDVLAVVACAPGMTVDPEELLRFLVPRLPHFMVPRYVRVLGELPKTPTNKVRKHELRDAAITPDTWDREAAGIVVRRSGVETREGR